jgi:hypothetical protein
MKMRIAARRGLLACVTFGGMVSPVIAEAQEAGAEELDALADAATSDQSALSTARAQAQAGDLTGAAATLERRLLSAPNANDVRLFYIGLMCQLDDAQGARVELTKLDRQALDDGAWDAANQACGGTLSRPAAPQATGQTGLSGEAYAGLAFDGDALGPLAAQFEIPNLPTPRKSGLSAIAGLRANYKADGYYDGGGLYAGAGIRVKHSVDGPDQKYLLGDARIGYGRQSGGGDYAIGAVIRHNRLFGNPFVTEYGGQAEVGFRSGDAGRVVVRGEAVYQDYAKTGLGAAGKGWRFDLSASYEKQLSENSFVAAGAALELKDARVKDFGYRGGRVFAAYQTGVGDKGHYFNLSSTLRFVDFKDSPPVLDRKDTRFFARAAYGLPVTDNGLKLEAAINYTVRGVNNRVTANPPPALVIGVADYRSFGAEMRLLWKF